MANKQFINEVHSSFESFFKNKEKEKRINDQTLSLKQISEGSPNVFLLCNFETLGYDFISPNIKNLFGVDPDLFKSNGIAAAAALFHPDQYAVIIDKIYPTMFSFFNEYALRDEIFDLSIYYQTLMKCADGLYRWFSHELKIFELLPNGKPKNALKTVSDIDDIKKDCLILFQIIKRTSEGHKEILFSNTYNTNVDCFKISVREAEVLDLVITGLSSKQIADKLNISTHTVNNHRKNMLQKNNFSNSHELINEAIRQGYAKINS